MRRRAFLLLSVLSVGQTAEASEAILLDSDRILVGDILRDVPPDVAAIDLGEAPPPGGSRMLLREDITRQLRKNSVDVASLDIPPSVRVQSARVVVMPLQFAERARFPVEKALKRGVQLRHIEVRSPVKMSPSATLDRVVIAPLPRRPGAHRTTAMLDIVRNGKVEQRVAVTLELLITPEGAQPEMRRGTRVNLVVSLNNATVSTEAIALAEGNIGDTIPFRVERTKKTLRGRIDSPMSASVVGS